MTDRQVTLFGLACKISDLSQDWIEAGIYLHRCLKINSDPLANALGHFYVSLLYFKKRKILLASEYCANASRLFKQTNCYPFQIYCHILYAAILAAQEYNRPAAILMSILESNILNLTPGIYAFLLCTLTFCCLNHRQHEKAEAFFERFGNVSPVCENLEFL